MVTGIIGGEGRDRLRGGTGDDLLIGGATAYDDLPAALLQIQAEWTSADPYATRVEKLRSGAGGLPKLDATTVFDDGAVDVLRGNRDLDWFLARTGDELPDRDPTRR
jgi:RTX calcium-binding nonapeptide repeat (4 copies)